MLEAAWLKLSPPTSHPASLRRVPFAHLIHDLTCHSRFLLP